MRVPEGYTEHTPPADLARHVICAWTRLVAPAFDGAVHRVLPDGCADVLFMFGRPGERGSGFVEASVVGPMTKAIVVQGPQPRLMIGARFAPGFAFAALGVPAAELEDQRVAYDLVYHDAAADIEAMAEPATDAERVAVVFDVVRRRLARGSAVPHYVRAAIRRIASVDGNIRVADLAEEIGVTRQQLARQFSLHVGLTTKMFARVMRTQAAVARADAARAAYPRDVNWSAIAQDLGYYDQPHFIDEFKSLTGLRPGEWK
jgi:AraC-like DNA-binding protein